VSISAWRADSRACRAARPLASPGVVSSRWLSRPVEGSDHVCKKPATSTRTSRRPLIDRREETEDGASFVIVGEAGDCFVLNDPSCRPQVCLASPDVSIIFSASDPGASVLIQTFEFLFLRNAHQRCHQRARNCEKNIRADLGPDFSLSAMISLIDRVLPLFAIESQYQRIDYVLHIAAPQSEMRDLFPLNHYIILVAESRES